MFRIALTFFVLTSCSWQPKSQAYKELYTDPCITHAKEMEESPYFVLLLVNARHLDYTDAQSFVKTLAKHPSDGSKNRDVGHAWILLQGEIQGKLFELEGGHTGEFGCVQATYMEGIMNNIEYGFSNPSFEQKMHPVFETNPVRYLWESQKDGIFQKGSGGHIPTFAAKLTLSAFQFKEILNFINHYDFSEYSLTENQCSSFVVSIAEIAGCTLQDKISMHLPKKLKMGNQHFLLWTDPCYETLTFSTPDILEKSLKKLVSEGRAEYGLSWYKRRAYSTCR